jgi:hypothetical protein
MMRSHNLEEGRRIVRFRRSRSPAAAASRSIFRASASRQRTGRKTAQLPVIVRTLWFEPEDMAIHGRAAALPLDRVGALAMTTRAAFLLSRSRRGTKPGKANIHPTALQISAITY